MNWNAITELEQLNLIDEESKDKKVFIFKHSTTCSISNAALNRLERKWSDSDALLVKPFYLDLLKHRNISNAIASKYNVTHESPQVLVIENANCTFNCSHFDISYDALMQEVTAE